MSLIEDGLELGANAVVPGSGVVLGALRKFGSFLKSIPWQVYAAIAAIAACWLLWTAHTHAVSAAHAQGFADATKQIQVAQDKVDAAQRTKNAITAGKQAVIDKEKVDALHASDSDIDHRAELIRVRHDAAQRAALAGPVPQAGQAAGGAAPATTCDGLSFEIALELLTEAAKLQAQLNAVLDWEDAQDALATEGQPAKDPAPGAGDSPASKE